MKSLRPDKPLVVVKAITFIKLAVLTSSNYVSAAEWTQRWWCTPQEAVILTK